jgi:hypothetical protein
MTFQNHEDKQSYEPNMFAKKHNLAERSHERQRVNTNENSKHGVPYDLKKTNYLGMK